MQKLPLEIILEDIDAALESDDFTDLPETIAAIETDALAAIKLRKLTSPRALEVIERELEHRDEMSFA